MLLWCGRTFIMPDPNPHVKEQSGLPKSQHGGKRLTSVGKVASLEIEAHWRWICLLKIWLVCSQNLTTLGSTGPQPGKCIRPTYQGWFLCHLMYLNGKGRYLCASAHITQASVSQEERAESLLLNHQAATRKLRWKRSRSWNRCYPGEGLA